MDAKYEVIKITLYLCINKVMWFHILMPLEENEVNLALYTYFAFRGTN